MKIVLDNKDLNAEPINKTSNYTSVETPLGSYSNKSLTWSQIENAVSYTILRNGKLWKKTAKTKLKVSNNGYSEYQIIAIDKNKPIIGRTRYSNLWLNTGHGTLGWTMACGSGAALAELVRGTLPEPDFPFLKC